MKKEKDEKFFNDLEGVKLRLPKRYFSIIEFLYPGKFTKDQIYNVIHHGVEDRQILKALKKVVSKNNIAA